MNHWPEHGKLKAFKNKENKMKNSQISKVFGGGSSWYYLVVNNNGNSKFIDSAHENDKIGMKRLKQKKKKLNNE